LTSIFVGSVKLRGHLLCLEPYLALPWKLQAVMVMPTQAKPTDRLFYWSTFSASDIYTGQQPLSLCHHNKLSINLRRLSVHTFPSAQLCLSSLLPTIPLSSPSLSEASCWYVWNAN